MFLDISIETCMLIYFCLTFSILNGLSTLSWSGTAALSLTLFTAWILNCAVILSK